MVTPSSSNNTNHRRELVSKRTSNKNSLIIWSCGLGPWLHARLFYWGVIVLLSAGEVMVPSALTAEEECLCVGELTVKT